MRSTNLDVSFKNPQSGFSTIELIVALSLFAVISVAAIQFVTQNEKSLLEGRNELTTQQKNAAIASFIYDDFRRDNLADTAPSLLYRNSSMPQDLQDAPPLIIGTIFGNGSRYNAVNPKCVLAASTDISNKLVFFDGTCKTVAGRTLAQNIDAALRQGAKITFAIEGGGGRCTLSDPLNISSRSSYVRAFVDDPSCLAQGLNPNQNIQAGKQIIFPRYV
ncbi:MAG: prepilin-type N-terminal cleavage/methylation domain-containing protein, partial [Candidatus Puniceispirillum sp.]|nr:prepilin-type N-terminal cleavage/methylation domain-containing protein [Candidatus Puniceispirillum sp.]